MTSEVYSNWWYSLISESLCKHTYAVYECEAETMKRIVSKITEDFLKSLRRTHRDVEKLKEAYRDSDGDASNSGDGGRPEPDVIHRENLLKLKKWIESKDAGHLESTREFVRDLFDMLERRIHDADELGYVKGTVLRRTNLVIMDAVDHMRSRLSDTIAATILGSFLEDGDRFILYGFYFRSLYGLTRIWGKASELFQERRYGMVLEKSFDEYKSLTGGGHPESPPSENPVKTDESGEDIMDWVEDELRNLHLDLILNKASLPDEYPDGIYALRRPCLVCNV